MKKEINIFIVAPKDVDKEREVVRDVCNTLDTLTNKRVRIQAISWKQFPMLYKDNPQKSIDKYFNKSDIFVIILWNRLGTIVEGLKGKLSHSDKVTGTQYEIESILSSKKESVLFYLKNKKYQEIHIADAEEMGKQKKDLEQFLEEIELLKTPTKYGYHTFSTSNEFKSLLIDHLSEILKNNYQINVDTSKKNHDNRIDKNETVPIISGSYYAGLYGVLVLVALMIFQTTHFLGIYSKDVKQMSGIFVLTILMIVLIGVKALPVTAQVSHANFRQVVNALARRGVFIVIFAILLSMYFWFYVIPMVTNLFH